MTHTRPVYQARWNPVRKGSLAACCGSRALYVWSDEWVGEGGVEEEMAECVGVPASEYTAECMGKYHLHADDDSSCNRVIRHTGHQVGA